MEQIIWCVGHYYSEGHCRLLRDRYCAVIKYDTEEEAEKFARALRRLGYDCRAVPIDTSVEDI